MVLTERLAGTAGDARHRWAASAESRTGIGVRVRPDGLSAGVRTASALAPSRLVVNRVVEVADPRSLDDAKLLEADLPRVKAVEKPNPVPQDDRGQVDLNLVAQLGLKRLPGNARAED
jgi:hypothetical protein